MNAGGLPRCLDAWMFIYRVGPACPPKPQSSTATTITVGDEDSAGMDNGRQSHMLYFGDLWGGVWGWIALVANQSSQTIDIR